MSSVTKSPDIPKARLITGAVVFGAGQLAPLLIPFVVDSALSATWKTVISGMLIAGIPELAILAAIGILGKEGYNYLKSRLKGAFLKAVPDRVSLARHRLGMTLFGITFLGGWAAPYLMMLLDQPKSVIIPLAITADVLLILSLLVLGGAFWDKLRGLFRHEA